MKFNGTVIKYGRDIDTDVIIPARYLNTSDPKELAKHCMQDLDPTFVERVKPGDIMVAEENFGCGSSREHAPIAIKAAGVSCVIAKSFARIFYRNAINTGLAILECPEAVDGIGEGDTVSVEVTEEKPSFARGRAVEVLEPSPQRTVPLCTQADVCGGCPWAALSYEAQLEAKRANVVSALVRTAHIDAGRAEELRHGGREAARQALR